MNDTNAAGAATSAPLAIAVNGATHRFEPDTTIAAMLRRLGIAPAGIAVAVNERVVRASAHAGHRLRDGDVVEIVRATSGG